MGEWVECYLFHECFFSVNRFCCGRWLAKSMDDGSTERLLVAELMKPKGSPEGEKRLIVSVVA